MKELAMRKKKQKKVKTKKKEDYYNITKHW